MIAARPTSKWVIQREWDPLWFCTSQCRICAIVWPIKIASPQALPTIATQQPLIQILLRNKKTISTTLATISIKSMRSCETDSGKSRKSWSLTMQLRRFTMCELRKNWSDFWCFPTMMASSSLPLSWCRIRKDWRTIWDGWLKRTKLRKRHTKRATSARPDMKIWPRIRLRCFLIK